VRIFPFFVAVIIALSFKVNALPPVIGPYNVSSASYKVPVIDSTDPSIWLFYPLCNTSSSSSTCKFPLISYLHGMAGGDIDLLGYALFFEQIASYGFIIAAPDSCDVGCTNPNKGAPYTDCAGLPPLQPDHWAPWYGEAFKAIEVSV
jgi:predicted dienelactone hydrolase